jgi:hypothetical protein
MHYEMLGMAATRSLQICPAGIFHRTTVVADIAQAHC